ncbi:SDR family NAD(P)-dependent oxidoreductase [Nocardia otitidiscaviarum]|uniref:SDR family NAD(P)-dependent oxidoreductase n=1 Tax=Nocardia otitidiscaviarum TaxID=1823 RepID=UPI0009DF0033|nr:SDR family NAD(P)-dependent oxidoreductase [Nocardia otitidiscaviarum]MBF6482662.1 SDR family NAD(P)-dependent oxidoreductase [Nocardia otitidiscaviarum]
MITGATNGIGKEMARALVTSGAALTIVARNPDKGALVAAELGAQPGAATGPPWREAQDASCERPRTRRCVRRIFHSHTGHAVSTATAHAGEY